MYHMLNRFRKYSNSVGDTSPRETTGCGTPSPLAVKNALSRYPPKQQERKETNYRLYESELDRTTRLKHASKCHRSKHKLKNRNLGEIRDNRESGRGANRTRANESKGLASGDEGPVPCSESSPGSGEGVSGKEPASSRFTLWVFDDGTIVKKRVWFKDHQSDLLPKMVNLGHSLNTIQSWFIFRVFVICCDGLLHSEFLFAVLCWNFKTWLFLCYQAGLFRNSLIFVWISYVWNGLRPLKRSQ